MAVDEENELWADASDVARFTGAVVTIGDLTQAQDIIDLFSGTTFGAYNNISPKNLRLLNRAVCYQAAWMQARPDLYTHMDVQSASQDGASFTPAGENAQLLAPMADRWLRRLTWRNKPLRVRRRYDQYDTDDTRHSRDSAVADDAQPWVPMR